jgi:hypothetical protein
MPELPSGPRWIGAAALLLAGCYTSGTAPTPISNTKAPADTGGRWIARSFHTTQLPLTGNAAQNQHETLTLQWSGTEATLLIQERSAAFAEGTEIGPWRAEPARRLVGRAAQKGRVIAFDFGTDVGGDRGGKGAVEFPCVHDSLDVAAATAVRRPSPAHDECGDTGHWEPAATPRLPVLRCRGLGFDSSIMPGDADWEAFASLAFARAPGVEWLHVNDDCMMQGGGWRAVPADGSITSPR